MSEMKYLQLFGIAIFSFFLRIYYGVTRVYVFTTDYDNIDRNTQSHYSVLSLDRISKQKKKKY